MAKIARTTNFTKLYIQREKRSRRAQRCPQLVRRDCTHPARVAMPHTWAVRVAMASNGQRGSQCLDLLVVGVYCNNYCLTVNRSNTKPITRFVVFFAGHRPLEQIQIIIARWVFHETKSHHHKHTLDQEKKAQIHQLLTHLTAIMFTIFSSRNECQFVRVCFTSFNV